MLDFDDVLTPDTAAFAGNFHSDSRCKRHRGSDTRSVERIQVYIARKATVSMIGGECSVLQAQSFTYFSFEHLVGETAQNLAKDSHKVHSIRGNSDRHLGYAIESDELISRFPRLIIVVMPVE